MNGLHLIGDLTGCRCDPQLLLDGERFRAKCLEMVAASGLTTMDATFHQFEGSGFTGTVVLAESHLAIHTWPERQGLTLDVYVCNYSADNSAKARKRSPSRRSCGSQRQPVRSPMRCRPFIPVPSKMRRRSLPRIWVPGHAFHSRLPAQNSALQSRSTRARPPESLSLLFNLLTNGINQFPSDRDFARKFRQMQ